MTLTVDVEQLPQKLSHLPLQLLQYYSRVRYNPSTSYQLQPADDVFNFIQRGNDLLDFRYENRQWVTYWRGLLPKFTPSFSQTIQFPLSDQWCSEIISAPVMQFTNAPCTPLQVGSYYDNVSASLIDVSGISIVDVEGCTIINDGTVTIPRGTRINVLGGTPYIFDNVELTCVATSVIFPIPQNDDATITSSYTTWLEMSTYTYAFQLTQNEGVLDFTVEIDFNAHTFKFEDVLYQNVVLPDYILVCDVVLNNCQTNYNANNIPAYNLFSLIRDNVQGFNVVHDYYLYVEKNDFLQQCYVQDLLQYYNKQQANPDTYDFTLVRRPSNAPPFVTCYDFMFNKQVSVYSYFYNVLYVANPLEYNGSNDIVNAREICQKKVLRGSFPKNIIDNYDCVVILGVQFFNQFMFEFNYEQRNFDKKRTFTLNGRQFFLIDEKFKIGLFQQNFSNIRYSYYNLGFAVQQQQPSSYKSQLLTLQDLYDWKSEVQSNVISVSTNVLGATGAEVVQLRTWQDGVKSDDLPTSSGVLGGTGSTVVATNTWKSTIQNGTLEQACAVLGAAGESLLSQVNNNTDVTALETWQGDVQSGDLPTSSGELGISGKLVNGLSTLDLMIYSPQTNSCSLGQTFTNINNRIIGISEIIGDTSLPPYIQMMSNAQIQQFIWSANWLQQIDNFRLKTSPLYFIAFTISDNVTPNVWIPDVFVQVDSGDKFTWDAQTQFLLDVTTQYYIGCNAGTFVVQNTLPTTVQYKWLMVNNGGSGSTAVGLSQYNTVIQQDMVLYNGNGGYYIGPTGLQTSMCAVGVYAADVGNTIVSGAAPQAWQNCVQGQDFTTSVNGLGAAGVALKGLVDNGVIDVNGVPSTYLATTGPMLNDTTLTSYTSRMTNDQVRILGSPAGTLTGISGFYIGDGTNNISCPMGVFSATGQGGFLFNFTTNQLTTEGIMLGASGNTFICNGNMLPFGAAFQWIFQPATNSTVLGLGGDGFTFYDYMYWLNFSNGKYVQHDGSFGTTPYAWKITSAITNTVDTNGVNSLINWLNPYMRCLSNSVADGVDQVMSYNGTPGLYLTTIKQLLTNMQTNNVITAQGAVGTAVTADSSIPGYANRYTNAQIQQSISGQGVRSTMYKFKICSLGTGGIGISISAAGAFSATGSHEFSYYPSTRSWRNITTNKFIGHNGTNFICSDTLPFTTQYAWSFPSTTTSVLGYTYETYGLCNTVNIINVASSQYLQNSSGIFSGTASVWNIGALGTSNVPFTIAYVLQQTVFPQLANLISVNSGMQTNNIITSGGAIGPFLGSLNDQSVNNATILNSIISSTYSTSVAQLGASGSALLSLVSAFSGGVPTFGQSALKGNFTAQTGYFILFNKITVNYGFNSIGKDGNYHSLTTSTNIGTTLFYGITNYSQYSGGSISPFMKITGSTSIEIGWNWYGWGPDSVWLTWFVVGVI